MVVLWLPTGNTGGTQHAGRGAGGAKLLPPVQNLQLSRLCPVPFHPILSVLALMESSFQHDCLYSHHCSMQGFFLHFPFLQRAENSLGGKGTTDPWVGSRVDFGTVRSVRNLDRMSPNPSRPLVATLILWLNVFVFETVNSLTYVNLFFKYSGLAMQRGPDRPETHLTSLKCVWSSLQ